MFKEKIEEIKDFIKENPDTTFYVGACAICAASCIHMLGKQIEALAAYKWEQGYANALIDVIKYCKES
jgi:hypothetical protein